MPSLANLARRNWPLFWTRTWPLAEKVSDGRDGFLRVFRAGTDREDEIPEGEFRAWL